MTVAMAEVADRGVLVLGLAASGTAAAEALAARGARVVAVDAADSAAVRARAADLRAAGVDARPGADLEEESLLSGIDLVVASPGVPPSRGVLVAAVASGRPVWGEPELAYRLAEGRTRLVGVTGTNGKTSTSELIAACLGVPAAGNIGTPLVSLLAGVAPPPLVVAELSSFQLHFTDALTTQVGVLLNLAPDHLDWHSSAQAYADDKARVWARQPHDGVAVVNGDDAEAVAVAARRPPAGRLVRFTLGTPAPDEVGICNGVITARLGGGDLEIAVADQLAVRGRHHLANACAAAAAALCAGADPAEVTRAVAGFRPGPHRLELVATLDEVDWVDDSKATNPHAAAAALAAYRSVVWIAGGLDKGLDFAPLAPLVAERARAVITIGATGPDIAELARGAGVRVVEAGTIDVAVPAAAELARPGDTVLLAPACASMDQFTDYAARGRAFRSCVERLRQPQPSRQV